VNIWNKNFIDFWEKYWQLANCVSCHWWCWKTPWILKWICCSTSTLFPQYHLGNKALLLNYLGTVTCLSMVLAFILQREHLNCHERTNTGTQSTCIDSNWSTHTTHVYNHNVITRATCYISLLSKQKQEKKDCVHTLIHT